MGGLQDNSENSDPIMELAYADKGSTPSASSSFSPGPIVGPSPILNLLPPYTDIIPAPQTHMPADLVAPALIHMQTPFHQAHMVAHSADQFASFFGPPHVVSSLPVQPSVPLGMRRSKRMKTVPARLLDYD